MEKKVELLLPAGNIEKLDYAINYGADAVYMGMVDFSLRTMRKGDVITAQNLKKAIDLAHSYGKKVYMTLNIYAYDDDIKNLYDSLDVIKDARPDALIISDFGILNIIKNNLPDIDIHISTQTNTLNSEAVKFWRDFGASRVILARELSIKQLAQIRKNVPDIELEVFVHGAQCVSLSGRCLLSDYMTHGERKANHGGCSQPCRWKYKLLEETRPGEYYEIEETARGTHILSTKDLALINYLPQLIEAGADSFKIEGRAKSEYYTAAVTHAYRAAIDEYLKDPSDDFKPSGWILDEINRMSHREYTTGFYFGPIVKGQVTDYGGYVRSWEVCALFKSIEGNRITVCQRNRFFEGEELEVLEPFKEPYTVRVSNLFCETDNEKTSVANKATAVYSFDSDKPVTADAIFRRKVD